MSKPASICEAPFAQLPLWASDDHAGCMAAQADPAINQAFRQHRIAPARAQNVRQLMWMQQAINAAPATLSHGLSGARFAPGAGDQRCRLDKP
jgi:hypothetical protein